MGMSRLHILHIEHWQMDDYKQRMTNKEWDTILLSHDDRICFKGWPRKLVAKKLSRGVVEVYKE